MNNQNARDRRNRTAIDLPRAVAQAFRTARQSPSCLRTIQVLRSVKERFLAAGQRSENALMISPPGGQMGYIAERADACCALQVRQSNTINAPPGALI